MAFAFELLLPTGNQTRRDAAVMIQAQLAALGIEVAPRQMELNAMIERTLEHDFEAFIGAWTIDTSGELGYAFHSEAIGDGYNFGSYSSAEVDRLIEAVRAAPDADAARPLLLRLQEILHTDQPYTFLWEPQRLSGVQQRLQGLAPNALSVYFRLQDWRIED